jgi:hypothetical protein
MTSPRHPSLRSTTLRSTTLRSTTLRSTTRSTTLRTTTLRSTLRTAMLRSATLLALVLALLTPTWVSAQSPAEGTNAALQGAPEGTDALAMRLRARHVRDLPRAETLRDPADLARLRWLAEHHRWLVVRTRALLLLAHDPSADTRTLVLRVLDSDAPRATESWTLDAALRSRLERLAREDDRRLGDPARRRLASPASATN